MFCCFRKRAHSIDAEYQGQAPPAWTPALEPSRRDGLYEDAPVGEFEAAESWCEDNPPYPPRLLPSYVIKQINAEGCAAWNIEHPTSSRFSGSVSQRKKGSGMVISVNTRPQCKSYCLMSDIPIMAGLYDARGKQGVYYEIRIISLQGIIALGTRISSPKSVDPPLSDHYPQVLHVNLIQNIVCLDGTDSALVYTRTT
jgi:hypothetical protein